MFVVFADNDIVGITGLFAYNNDMELVVYLHENFQGKGIAEHCHMLAWHLCQYLEFSLYAGVKVWNERSLAAMRKLYPQLTPQLTDEISVNDQHFESYNWKLTQPPHVKEPIERYSVEELYARHLHAQKQ